MSDGNFNRTLYPSTPYASGLKAGRAQGRQWAIEAFRQWLAANLPELNASDAEAQVESFRTLMASKFFNS